MMTFQGKHMPLVSIIIPCYNGQDYVSRSIQSALDQSYENTEIILVDNNSNDNTLSILEDFQKQYPSRIRVFSEIKQGAPAARNKGLNEANGEWIQFLDSDDSILPEKIEKQVQIATQGNVGLVVGNFSYVDQEKKIDVIALRDKWSGLLKSRLGITSANLWRKKDVIDVAGFDEELVWSNDEYDLMFRMLKNQCVVKYDTVFQTFVKVRRSSVSRSMDKVIEGKILKSRITLVQNIAEFLFKENLFEKHSHLDFKRFLYILLTVNKYKHPDIYRSNINKYDFRCVPIIIKCKVHVKALIKAWKK